MKSRTLLLVFAISVILQGCGVREVKHLLCDVESFIYERPDSALAILDTMDRSSLSTPGLRAHHALLHAMALDKNYIDVTDDSLARIAVDYYSKHGPKKYEARSRYYLGLSYYYREDYNNAIIEFTKAESPALESDSLYLGMLKVVQADTYAKTYNVIEEYNYLLQAHDIFKALGNSYYYQAVMLRLSQTYSNNGDDGKHQTAGGHAAKVAVPLHQNGLRAVSCRAYRRRRAAGAAAHNDNIHLADNSGLPLSLRNGLFLRKSMPLYLMVMGHIIKRMYSGSVFSHIIFSSLCGIAPYSCIGIIAYSHRKSNKGLSLFPMSQSYIWRAGASNARPRGWCICVLPFLRRMTLCCRGVHCTPARLEYMRIAVIVPMNVQTGEQCSPLRRDFIFQSITVSTPHDVTL